MKSASHYPGSLEGAVPLWNRVHHLSVPKRREIIKEGLLGLPEALKRHDKRGLMLATADFLSSPKEAERAIGWMGAALKIQDSAHQDSAQWSRLCAAFVSITQSFFANAGNAGAWVYFESCRDSIASQNPTTLQFPVGDVGRMPVPKRCNRGSYVLQDVLLPRFALEFVGPRGTLSSSDQLVRFRRRREVPLSEHHCIFGNFDTWCIAGHEDDELLGRGAVPAGSLFQRDSINIGVICNWVKVIPGGYITTISVEVDPYSSRIVTIRRIEKIPLELLLRIHPRYHDWLDEAVGGELGKQNASWDTGDNPGVNELSARNAATLETHFPEAYDRLLRQTKRHYPTALRWFAVFRAVAECKTRTRAANALRYSKRNVTLILRNLEACLGNSVVWSDDEGRREWRLTELGEALNNWLKHHHASILPA